MTIGELAARTGLPASTIRHWERAGVLPKPARVSGRRRYAGETLYQIAALRLAQACGFTLSQMRYLFSEFGSGSAPAGRWRELARPKQIEIDKQLLGLRAMRRLLGQVARCRCAAVGECGRTAAELMTGASV